jgi:trigger factor
MQVIQTIADGLKHQFKVVIPAGQLSAQVDTRLVEVGRTARIPGFRPGKIPLGILRKKYGPSVLNEVLEGAVNEGTDRVLKDHDVRPALRPKVEVTSFNEGGDLEFTIGVESLPVVEVADLSSLALERPFAEVTDDAIAEALDRIAQSQEKTESAPDGTVAGNSDVLVIDFVGSVAGVPFEGGAGEAVALKLGSKTFIPGFEDQLVGAKAGDQTTVLVTFPGDYGKADLAGKAAAFAVTVKEVRKAVPAIVDEDLAKGLGFDDLAGLKDRVRQEIADDYADLSRARLKRSLMDALADLHSFAVPEGMVDVEFNSIWTQLESDKAAGQLDPVDAAKSDDELKSEYRSIAERRVRLGLVLSEIGVKNNVVVSQEDINRALYAQARRYPGQEQAVIQYYQKNREALMSLRAPLFEEKVVDFLIANAKITEKRVAPAELAEPEEGAEETAPAAEAPAKAKPKAKKKAAAEVEPVAEQPQPQEVAAEASVEKPKKAAPRKKAAAKVEE